MYLAGSAFAQNEPNWRAQQFEAGGPNISVHPINPIDTAPTAGGTGSLSPIINHGGPVMGTPKAYLIWYGNWNQTNGSDTPAARSRLSDNGVFSVVSNAITSGALLKDANGVYFVITSSDIAKTGFCTQYCGWHTYGTVGGTTIKYSFVGNANRCLSACAAQTVGPNGNAGVDGMLSVMAHELEETNTDPNLNAWYDSSGNENGDKCAWTFGQSQTLGGNGAYYNMSLPALSTSSRNYLIQRNLSATDNKCYVNILTKAQ